MPSGIGNYTPLVSLGGKIDNQYKMSILPDVWRRTREVVPGSLSLGDYKTQKVATI